MSSKPWTDEEILAGITGTMESRNRALNYIFYQTEWMELTVNYVKLQWGTEQDGEDIFQETIILFDRNLRRGDFQGGSKLRTYFIGIAKRLWWKQLQNRHPREELSPQHYDEVLPSVEAMVINEEKKSYLVKAMGIIGERCKHILQLYQLNYSMEEIASAVPLSNAAMAKKEAYRCRLRLRQFLDDNPGWKSLVK
ncbi:MAG: RNA polymerase sigma factor [Lewinellaceae bacterium]|nr:RNA polymerase sigma factor [Phaeodactylibacter sp.]MCB9035673.1 RNA polymerase sigma factor [Lewinellaceae bacterium]